MINLWTEVAGHWIQPDIIKAIHPVTYDKYEEKWHITFAHEARFGLTDYAIWCKTQEEAMDIHKKLVETVTSV